jgi:membrane protein YqaA with SNARE-associated domain
MEKKTAAKLVKSTLFKRIFLVLGIIFIALTYFISVTPDSFLVYGYFGVFLYNIFASSILIMPILVEKMNLFWVIIVSALGNIPNTSINYLVGNTSKRFFSNNPFLLLIKKWMEKYGLIVVYLIAIIPLPIDVNGLMAGYVDIPYKKYILVNFLGRCTSFLLAGLGVWTFVQATK